MQPDVSIIIATYNIEGYIARAVESALTQSGVTVEVILVDDCSTDCTWDVIGKLTDPRIRAFRLAQNGGPSAARNKGFAEATGTWIAVLDGDDIYLPGRLKRMIDRAIRENSPLIIDNQIVHREADGREFPMFSAPHFARLGDRLTLARFIRGKLALGNKYTLGYLKPVLLKRYLDEQHITYDETIRVGEDYLLLVDALAFGGRCAVEPEAGYRYTARAGSISHRLTVATIARMRERDARLLSRHRSRMGFSARLAYHFRAFFLYETLAFTLLVDAIKERNIPKALRAILMCPTAPRHLWEAVWKRLTRLAGIRA
jgi:succinoglycan biosynthesis protein ExoO